MLNFVCMITKKMFKILGTQVLYARCSWSAACSCCVTLRSLTPVSACMTVPLSICTSSPLDIASQQVARRKPPLESLLRDQYVGCLFRFNQ